MVTVGNIFEALDELAPVDTKMDFDNVGLLVGDPASEVRRIVTTLDITNEVITEASELDAQLIVSHHPLFFELKNVRADDLVGRKVLALCKNGVSAICMHTNLDVAARGVNDALAKVLGLLDVAPLQLDGYNAEGLPYGLGRVGAVSEMTLSKFLDHVRTALHAAGLRYVDGGQNVRTVGVCGGSGGSELQRAALLGCDTFVTADVKHNVFLDAVDLGINLIDAGHFSTENVVVEPLRAYLAMRFPELDVSVSQCCHQMERFFL